MTTFNDNVNLTRITILNILISILILTFTSCRKLVEVDPPTNAITTANAFENDATAIAVLTGLYTDMSGGVGFSGRNRISFLASLSADELTLGPKVADPAYLAYYRNQLTSTNISSGGSDIWTNLYPLIYRTNVAIKRLNASQSLTTAIKEQLLGEAKFIRALVYFYLVSLYGDVPLVTDIDYKVNSSLPRTFQSNVWQLIISDLKEARGQLSMSFLDGNLTKQTSERVRPTGWAANALLSRAYLFTGEYENAEQEATAVINNSTLFDTVPLNNVFLKNSKEAIWQLQPVSTTPTNTWDGNTFIISSTGPDTRQGYLSVNLLNSFEIADQRRRSWVDSVIVGGVTYRFPFKYKIKTNQPVTEYTMVLRLSELYLIRAEARVYLDNVNGAKEDLNKIRVRAGLPPTTANDKPTILQAILKERQVELFTEWGHRWLDLKRTGMVINVMPSVTQQKGGTWETDNHDQWYPVPLTELQANPNLTQTSGY